MDLDPGPNENPAECTPWIPYTGPYTYRPWQVYASSESTYIAQITGPRRNGTMLEPGEEVKQMAATVAGMASNHGAGGASDVTAADVYADPDCRSKKFEMKQGDSHCDTFARASVEYLKTSQINDRVPNYYRVVFSKREQRPIVEMTLDIHDDEETKRYLLHRARRARKEGEKQSIAEGSVYAETGMLTIDMLPRMSFDWALLPFFQALPVSRWVGRMVDGKIRPGGIADKTFSIPACKTTEVPAPIGNTTVTIPTEVIGSVPVMRGPKEPNGPDYFIPEHAIALFEAGHTMRDPRVGKGREAPAPGTYDDYFNFRILNGDPLNCLVSNIVVGVKDDAFVRMNGGADKIRAYEQRTGEMYNGNPEDIFSATMQQTSLGLGTAGGSYDDVARNVASQQPMNPKYMQHVGATTAKAWEPNAFNRQPARDNVMSEEEIRRAQEEGNRIAGAVQGTPTVQADVTGGGGGGGGNPFMRQMGQPSGGYGAGPAFK